MTPEPIFEARDGEVFYRGVWLPMIHAEPLLANLKPQASDWAAEHVRQLEQAIKEAEAAHA